jgi:NADPH2:quinone reductase
VTELGEGVTNLSIGDEVYSYCRGPVVHSGTFAEYCCFEAGHVVLKPKNLSFAQAAAIPLVGLTAWQALFDVANLKKGQTCLIHAGAGGVGSLALPLARWTGAKVFTTASSKNHAYCKGIGADEVIDYNTTNFVDFVKERCPEGVDFVFDCVGGETLQNSYGCVKKGGCLVSIVEPVSVAKAQECGINAQNVFVRPSGEQLFRLKERLESGDVPCPAIHEMELDEVVSALEKVKTEHTRGKIVLKVKG